MMLNSVSSVTRRIASLVAISFCLGASAFAGNKFVDLPNTPKGYEQVVGISGSEIIYNTYVYTAPKFSTLPPYTGKNSTGSQEEASGASAGNIVGLYIDPQDYFHGFVLRGGKYTILDPPDSISTSASGMSGDNVVGSFAASNSNHRQAFVYNTSSASFQTFNDPDSDLDTIFNGISGNLIIGAYEYLGRLYDFYFDLGTKTFTTLPSNPLNDADRSPYNTATGVDGNNIVGYYTDDSGIHHGFLFTGGQYTNIDHPLGVNGTVPEGISGNRIVGYYFDMNGVQRNYLCTLGPITPPPPVVTISNADGAAVETVAQTISGSVTASAKLESVSYQVKNQAGTISLPKVPLNGKQFDAATGAFNFVTLLSGRVVKPSLSDAAARAFDLTVYALEKGGVTGSATVTFSQDQMSFTDSIGGQTAASTLYADLAFNPTGSINKNNDVAVTAGKPGLSDTGYVSLVLQRMTYGQAWLMPGSVSQSLYRNTLARGLGTATAKIFGLGPEVLLFGGPASATAVSGSGVSTEIGNLVSSSALTVGDLYLFSVEQPRRGLPTVGHVGFVQIGQNGAAPQWNFDENVNGLDQRDLSVWLQQIVGVKGSSFKAPLIKLFEVPTP
jgi:hypothetical protein